MQKVGHWSGSILHLRRKPTSEQLTLILSQNQKQKELSQGAFIWRLMKEPAVFYSVFCCILFFEMAFIFTKHSFYPFLCVLMRFFSLSSTAL